MFDNAQLLGRGHGRGSEAGDTATPAQATHVVVIVVEDGTAGHIWKIGEDYGIFGGK